jgi:hypothetical protein
MKTSLFFASLLATTLLFGTIKAYSKEDLDYKRLCDKFPCWNKQHSLCLSREMLKKNINNCPTYDPKFGGVFVVHQVGNDCQIADDGKVGWIGCNFILFDPSKLKQ